MAALRMNLHKDYMGYLPPCYEVYPTQSPHLIFLSSHCKSLCLQVPDWFVERELAGMSVFIILICHSVLAWSWRITIVNLFQKH